MALSATLYVFAIDLADSDRGVYTSLELRVARHPSEAAEHLLTRVLAYCLEYAEGIAFSKGLFDPDEPALCIRDLTGALQTWIDVGAPEAARLHRASKASPRVVVYTHKDAEQLVARLTGEKIYRIEALELYALDRDWLTSLAERLTRRMAFTLTVSEQHVYLSLGEETLSAVIRRIPLQPR
ncbi:MAG: YaeQ family protein [Gammaproteobacteria bacterium]